MSTHTPLPLVVAVLAAALVLGGCATPLETAADGVRDVLDVVAESEVSYDDEFGNRHGTWVASVRQCPDQARGALIDAGWPPIAPSFEVLRTPDPGSIGRLHDDLDGFMETAAMPEAVREEHHTTHRAADGACSVVEVQASQHSQGRM